jgi:hypothetical protein
MGKGVEASDLLVDRLGGGEWANAISECLQVGKTD